MGNLATRPNVARFSCFEVDLRSGELSRNGRRIRIQEKPFQILACLLEQPGEFVSRDELQARLWPDGTFVDFEHGLNSAVNRLRLTLGDSADSPRFIETVPRRGYRFVAAVEFERPADAATGENGAARPAEPATPEPESGALAMTESAEGAPESSPAAAMVAQESALPADGAVTAAKPRRRPALPVIRPPSARWMAAGLVLTLLAAALASFLHRALLWAPTEERAWVLVTAFENRTGEPALEGIVESALHMELANSRLVNVVPRERLDDVLRLMRRPAGTVVDGVLGREVALRDGGVRAMLTGRVTKLGTHYVLAVELVDPVTGVALASHSQESPSQNDVWPATRRMLAWLRETIETRLDQIPRREAHLEKATTASLRALQLYTQAMGLVNEHRWAPAEQLLRQAVAEDPEFASAHILLAHCIRGQLGPEDERTRHSERAFALASSTSEPERYFILGSHHGFQGEHEKSASYYEGLVRLSPDHYWGHNNLAFAYENMDRWKDAVPYWVRRAELRPSDALASYRAAVALAARGEGFAEARPYYLRARGRIPFTDGGRLSLEVPIGLYPAFEYWAAGDPHRVFAELRRVDEEMRSRDPAEREFIDWALSLSYITLGRLDDAERFALRYPDRGDAPLQRALFALIAFERGDRPALLGHAAALGKASPLAPWAIKMTHAGLLDDAETMAKALPGERPGRINQIAHAELAFARGDCDTGVRLAADAIPLLRNTWYSEYLIGSESLALAFQARGEIHKAIQVLEEASREQRSSFPDRSSYWNRVRFRLSRIYRAAGRESDAREVEAQLRRLLAVADRDHPMLKALDTGGELPIELPAARACRQ